MIKSGCGPRRHCSCACLWSMTCLRRISGSVQTRQACVVMWASEASMMVLVAGAEGGRCRPFVHAPEGLIATLLVQGRTMS